MGLLKLHYGLLLLALAGTPCQATEQSVDPLLPENPDPDGPGLTEQMDSGHTALSRGVVALAERVDRLFGGAEYEEYTEGSLLRVSLTSLVEEDGTSFDPQLRLQLALPNTERRFSFVLESEEDRLEEGRADTRPLRSAVQDERYVAGIRYFSDLADYWNFDLDLGVRVRLPLDPFVEGRLSHSYFIGIAQLRPSLSAFWRSSEGPGLEGELLFQRPLPGPRFFRSDSRATWLQDDETIYYRQTFSVTHEFTPLHAIQARLGVFGDSEPVDRVTSYYVNVGWRRNVYKDWLFLELRPELLFERESDFDRQRRFFLILEAFFGKQDRPELNPVPPAREVAPANQSAANQSAAN